MVAVDLLVVRGRGHPVAVLGRVSVLGLAVGHDVGQRQGLRAGTQLCLEPLLLLDLLSAGHRGTPFQRLRNATCPLFLMHDRGHF